VAHHLCVDIATRSGTKEAEALEALLSLFSGACGMALMAQLPVSMVLVSAY